MKSWCIVLAALAMLSFVSVSQSCDFCMAETGPTITSDYADATAVVIVHVENGPVQDANGNLYTELTIDQVIKSHDCLKNVKTFKLRRPIDKSPSQILLLCDVYENKLDPFRGVEVVPGGDLVKYLQGSLANREKPIAERLRFAFDYLNSGDVQVGLDAYREFAKADYKDYKTMAKTLPADKIAGWLKDEKTQPYRYGLYASLLGHCGTAEHAKLLRKKVEESIKDKGSNLEGLLAGYVMLQPKEAWGYVGEILREGKEEFAVRYACVRTASFLRVQRPDLVPAKDLTSTVALLLNTPDMADHGIEYLRKVKQWDMTDQVLDLYGKKDFDNDFMKRSILRFALSSTAPRAAAFVKDMRARNAEFVEVTHELLKIDEKLAN